MPKKTNPSLPKPKRNAKGQIAPADDDLEFLADAYVDYCEWLKAGNPCKFWTYVDFEKNRGITWETMKKYIDRKAEPIDPLLMLDALRKRFEYWMAEGRKLITGAYKGGSPKTWENVMRNTFKDKGWDSTDDARKEDFKTDLENFINGQAQKLIDSQ